MLEDMTQLTRPAIGILVDPERMAAARKSAMLERIELAHLSQALDLRAIAAEEGVDTGPTTDVTQLKKKLADAGVPIKRPGVRIGVSRDEIAKLETGGRKRPKITTMRKLITTLNYARAELGKPPLQIEDLQVPGEVLIPDARPEIPEWEEELLQEHAARGKEEEIRDMLAREADEAEAVADEEESRYFNPLT